MQQKIKEILEGYPCILELPVQWGDMDTSNHVNNVQYLKYFESGRVAYYQMITGEQNFTSKAPVVAEITVKYKIPVVFPDTIYIGNRVIEMDEYSMVMDCAITSQRIPAITTTARVRMVYFDIATQSKTPIPQSFIDKVKEIEGI